MTEEQNTKKNKKPSQELTKLLIDLKTTISTLKELYQTIDKRAQVEGYSIEEIYDIANITETTATTKNNNNNILFPHFQ